LIERSDRQRGEHADTLRQHPVGILEREGDFCSRAPGRCRIRNAPVRGHRLSGPDGTGFASGIVANGKYKIESGRSGLRIVFETPTTTIFAVPSPVPIVTGPRSPRVVALTQTKIVLDLNVAGTYRLAVRYSPYFAATGACLTKTKGGMTRLDVARPGRVRLAFAVTPGRALAALAGSKSTCDGD